LERKSPAYLQPEFDELESTKLLPSWKTGL